MKTNRLIAKMRIEEALKTDYDYEIIGGKTCFTTNDGGYIRLDTIGDELDCVVIEYAENRKDAINNVFEDGDLLYMNEMSEAEMIDEVKKNIDG